METNPVILEASLGDRVDSDDGGPVFDSGKFSLAPAAHPIDRDASRLEHGPQDFGGI